MADEQTKGHIETPIVETEPQKTTKSRIPLMVAAAIVLVLGGGIAALAFLGVESKRVYIDTSTIQAPSIPLAPTANGTLKSVNVAVGDVIQPNTVVAEVGTQLITSTIGGLVISSDTDIGSVVNAGTPVVTMIDPTAVRSTMPDATSFAISAFW